MGAQERAADQPDRLPPPHSIHLVGAGEQRGRNGEAERGGGLEIKHELVFRRSLHRQIGRAFAFENAVRVLRGALELVRPVRSERDEPAGDDEGLGIIDGRELVLGGQAHDQVAVAERPGAGCDDEPGIPGPRQAGDRLLDIGPGAHGDRPWLEAEQGSDRLDDAPLADAGRDVGIAHDADALEARRDLLEHLHPLAADAVVEARKPGGVAAGLRKVLDETCADGIGNDREDDRGWCGWPCSAGPAAALPGATIKLGPKTDQSAAPLRTSSGPSPPHLRSIRRLRPSLQPSSSILCRNAPSRARYSASPERAETSTPTRRTRSVGCAHALMLQTAGAVTSPLTTSRRFIEPLSHPFEASEACNVAKRKAAAPCRNLPSRP